MIVISKNFFLKYGHVVECLPTDIIEVDDENKEYKYLIGEFNSIEEPNDLRSFAYSLPKVYKYFNEPEKHFIRNFGSISEYEFNVITNHDYFITRMAFGKILNSVHPDHKKAFITNVLKIYPNTLLITNSKVILPTPNFIVVKFFCGRTWYDFGPFQKRLKMVLFNG